MPSSSHRFASFVIRKNCEFHCPRKALRREAPSPSVEFRPFRLSVSVRKECLQFLHGALELFVLIVVPIHFAFHQDVGSSPTWSMTRPEGL